MELPLLSRAEFVRLGLIAMKQVNPNYTPSDWHVQFEDLMEQWNKMVMISHEDRTNYRRKTQILRTEQIQQRYDVYS
jgi:hypothetical protein